MASGGVTNILPLTECAPIGDLNPRFLYFILELAPYMGQVLSNEVSALINANVEITEKQLKPSIYHLKILPNITNQLSINR